MVGGATATHGPGAARPDPPARRRVRGLLPVLVPVLLVAGVVLGVMGARLVGPCDADPGCFVVAGSRFTDAEASGLPVAGGAGADGYDGQFFWRLSRSPGELGAAEVHGVTLDTVVRVGRPGYPVAAWLASGGGQEGVVDWALVGVNVAATVLLSLVLALTARRHGAPAWLGAAAALWPGLLYAAGRDLSEPGSALLVVVGLAVLARGHPGPAGLAWAAAVLWREQALLVPAAYGVWWLVTLARRAAPARDRSGQAWAVVPWLAPLAAFAAWQAVAAAAVGRAPVLASGEQNVVLPLTGLVPEAAGWVGLDDGTVGLVWLVQLGAASAITTTAVVVGARTRRWETLAVLLGAAALLSASRNVWGGPAHLRYATDLVMTAWFLLLSTRPVAPPPSGREARAWWRGALGLPAVRVGLLGLQLVGAALACVYLVRAR